MRTTRLVHEFLVPLHCENREQKLHSLCISACGKIQQHEERALFVFYITGQRKFHASSLFIRLDVGDMSLHVCTKHT